MYVCACMSVSCMQFAAAAARMYVLFFKVMCVCVLFTHHVSAAASAARHFVYKAPWTRDNGIDTLG